MLSKNATSEEFFIDPGPDAHERLQEAMIIMNEGDTLTIRSGYYAVSYTHQTLTPILLV